MDKEFKVRFKSFMKSDDYCNSQLMKLEEKGVTFNELWEEKIYSSVGILIYYYYSSVNN